MTQRTDNAAENAACLGREEIAHLEIGRTVIPASLARLMMAAFLLLVFAVPAVQLLDDLVTESTRPLLLEPLTIAKHAVRAARESEGNFISRVRAANSAALLRISELDDRFDHDSVLSRRLLSPTQRVLSRWTGLGNEQVYLGRDGWLFYRPEVDYVTGAGFLDPGRQEQRARLIEPGRAPIQPDPLRAILDFDRLLRARGIELIVLIAPSKTVIYPEMFLSRLQGIDHPLRNPDFNAFIESLEAQGVRIFDPAEMLLGWKAESASSNGGDERRPLYLPTDTHWSPETVERLAAVLAARILDLNVLSDVAPARYKRERRQAINTGDLAVMLSLAEDQGGYRAETVHLNAVLLEDGEPYEPDREAEVLVLGDSFVNIYADQAAFAREADGMTYHWGGSAGFVEQLAWCLRRPVDRIAHNAGGAHATRETLRRMLARGDDRLAGKRVVIWQFAERELAVGDWRLIELPEPLQPRERGLPPDAAIVMGRVAAASRPPRPGSVPYTECLISIHLTDVTHSDGSAFEEPDLLLLTWGMRNNRWTGAAEMAAGTRMSVTFRPWEAVEREHGAIQQIPLGGEADFLPVVWVEDFERD